MFLTGIFFFIRTLRLFITKYIVRSGRALAMAQIKSIHIKNIKGKEDFYVNLKRGIIANRFNILVAPNGYGKSTITAAFKGVLSSNNKINISKNDQHENGSPSLEIEVQLDENKTYISNEVVNEIKQYFEIIVINSTIYAENTGKTFGKVSIKSAELRVKDEKIFTKIPEKKEISYKLSEIKKRYSQKGFIKNQKEWFNKYDIIKGLYHILKQIEKYEKSKRINKIIKDFLEEFSNTNDRGIGFKYVDKLKEKGLTDIINFVEESIEGKYDAIDIIGMIVQIFYIYKNNDLKAIYLYKRYEHIIDDINREISNFNNTKRNIHTHREKNNVVVRFPKAESISNGERDVLTLLIKLIKLKYIETNKPIILLIDELFDYLDGGNILAIQYYLSTVIDDMKDEGKCIFPIVFTHLDPVFFKTYVLRKPHIHYISVNDTVKVNENIKKVLIKRTECEKGNQLKEAIEKNILHFITYNFYSQDEEKMLKKEKIIESNTSIESFRNELYNEVTEKYLKGKNYDPLSVSLALRIKIEERIFLKLSDDEKNGFIAQNGTKNKLEYAEKNGINVEKIFFMLGILYNETMHLNNKENENERKIAAAYLKLDNIHIKRMIAKVFEISV